MLGTRLHQPWGLAFFLLPRGWGDTSIFLSCSREHGSLIVQSACTCGQDLQLQRSRPPGGIFYRGGRHTWLADPCGSVRGLGSRDAAALCCQAWSGFLGLLLPGNDGTLGLFLGMVVREEGQSDSPETPLNFFLGIPQLSVPGPWWGGHHPERPKVGRKENDSDQSTA